MGRISKCVNAIARQMLRGASNTPLISIRRLSVNYYITFSKAPGNNTHMIQYDIFELQYNTAEHSDNSDPVNFTTLNVQLEHYYTSCFDYKGHRDLAIHRTLYYIKKKLGLQLLYGTLKTPGIGMVIKRRNYIEK